MKANCAKSCGCSNIYAVRKLFRIFFIFVLHQRTIFPGDIGPALHAYTFVILSPKEHACIGKEVELKVSNFD